jgi:hypothetical protein
MSRDRILTGFVCLALAVLAITILTALTRRSLSPVEAQLVGRWTQVAMPDAERVSPLVFTSKGTFYCEEGGIEGRWWIENGQLFVQQWTDEDSHIPFVDVVKALRTDADGLLCTFQPDGNTVELALPGKQPLAVLSRDENW